MILYHKMSTFCVHNKYYTGILCYQQVPSLLVVYSVGQVVSFPLKLYKE